MKTLVCTFSLITSITAFAATHQDFYCSEIPQAPPVYYNLVVKSCGDGKKTESTEGVCALTVVCAYVSDDVKAAAKIATKKPFNKLSDEEKKNFLKGPAVEWTSANLTCQGEKTALGAKCPPPEQCKGDVLFKMEQGMIAAQTLQEIRQRIPNESKVFQTAPSSGAGK